MLIDSLPLRRVGGSCWRHCGEDNGINGVRRGILLAECRFPIDVTGPTPPPVLISFSFHFFSGMKYEVTPWGADDHRLRFPRETPAIYT